MRVLNRSVSPNREHPLAVYHYLKRWVGVRGHNVAFQPQLVWCKMRLCGPGRDTDLLKTNGFCTFRISAWMSMLQHEHVVDVCSMHDSNRSAGQHRWKPFVFDAFPEFRVIFCHFQNWQSLVPWTGMRILAANDDAT